MFYNDLCYQYFGEGYKKKFKVDDIKAGCRVLSYRAFNKREKMIVWQMMNIYNHPQAIYHRFLYFYKIEFHNKDHLFNNWFIVKLPQFFTDGNNEYISFIFLYLLKVYEHHNIQEKICQKK